MSHPSFFSKLVLCAGGVSVWAFGFSLAAYAQPAPREWDVDGVKRQALVFVPAQASSEPAPLIFGFHGHGGKMEQVARSFAYQTHWPEAVVVYMQGLNTPGRLTDPEGKKPGWQSQVGDQQDRDLKFFDAVLASVKKEFSIDTNRIYATGHSNGGGFTYLLWQERGDVLAAVAPSASAARRGDRAKVQAKPLLHIAGQNDPLVKFEWQEKMIEGAKAINGCQAEGTPWHSAGPLTGTIYASPQGTPVVTLFHQGGHKFLKETPPLIVKFFQEYSKK